jgi:hypothetical protein
MSLEPQFPGLFAAEQGAMKVDQPLPATEKQVAYARAIALRTGDNLPDHLLQNRPALSAWIEARKAGTPVKPSRFSSYPSSKQVAFAERIARIKRRSIPRECFQDKGMMSKWIDGNKPR